MHARPCLHSHCAAYACVWKLHVIVSVSEVLFCWFEFFSSLEKACLLKIKSLAFNTGPLLSFLAVILKKQGMNSLIGLFLQRWRFLSMCEKRPQEWAGKLSSVSSVNTSNVIVYTTSDHGKYSGNPCPKKGLDKPKQSLQIETISLKYLCVYKITSWWLTKCLYWLQIFIS